ncbi:MAG: (Fe-S)-binding protein [Thermoleophilia bacterium]
MHLRRGLGVSLEPREIIAGLPGVEYVESAEEPACCGGAGLFSLMHKDLSFKIGTAWAEEIAASGARIVATGCQGCRNQLTDIFYPRGTRHTCDANSGANATLLPNQLKHKDKEAEEICKSECWRNSNRWAKISSA